MLFIINFKGEHKRFWNGHCQHPMCYKLDTANTSSAERSKDHGAKPRKSLVFEEFTKLPYKSPIEIDIDMKRKELQFKETELALITSKYDDLSEKYTPVMHGSM